MELKQCLNNYCFQANQFDIKGADKVEFGDESIYLVEGDYSEEMGFIREKRQNYSSEEAFIL